MTDRYQVVGNPIAQSKSPLIHQAFARQTGQDLRYDRACPAVDGFAEHARAFFTDGGKGMNITAPFKLDAFNFADRQSPRAQRAGAANTLMLSDDGAIIADNTDGYGLVSDLREHLGWSLLGQRLLVLGAGGAVRGVLQPLLEAGPAELVLANRTLSKALDLAAIFSDIGTIQCVGFEALADLDAFDLVINATSAGLSGAMPDLPAGFIGPASRVYDMTYGAEPTPFLRWARAQGAIELADGLGMLVGQAAEAFWLWRGVRPELAPVLATLRAAL